MIFIVFLFGALSQRNVLTIEESLSSLTLAQTNLRESMNRRRQVRGLTGSGKNKKARIPTIYEDLEAKGLKRTERVKLFVKSHPFSAEQQSELHYKLMNILKEQPHRGGNPQKGELPK
eukprot:NODE_266_length_12318_cov_0.301498.p8 type:complete len:118 gc:universal NODE_266_length_12318_cov_0.301498:9296-9649(+)